MSLEPTPRASYDATRRDFLRTVAATAGGAALAGAWPAILSADDRRPRLKVAAILTHFFRRSHAHVILENFIRPALFNGQWVDGRCDVVSMYVDQFHADDMARAVSREFKIPIYPTIAEALTLGNNDLSVDAVLSIGEHGHYPTNEKGQVEYPRKRFFDEIAAVCRRSGRGVPVFNDKHLSYRWDWAKEMVDTARELKMPFMAGSSVPLAQRRPPLELPAGADIVEAVSIHGGGVESYDFHALEVLQSLVEARRGGETGVKSVQFLDGDLLWKAADQGQWSPKLAAAAMAAEVGPDHELTKAVTNRGRAPGGAEVDIHGIQINYRDGLRGMALKVGGSGIRWNFACNLKGETSPRATSIYVGPWENRNLFRALSHAIQEHFHARQAPYPVERTLLTTGILAAAMDSRHEGRKPLDTPHLDVVYEPRDFRAVREMGATWKIVPEGTPEPEGILAAPA